MFRKRIPYLLGVLLVVTMLAGCTAAKKPVPPQPGPSPQVNPGQNRTAAETRDISADVNQAAESVAGVERAYSVVVGNTALVGFDMEANKQEEGIKQVKDSVARKVQADSRIVRAYVSSDPDVTSRIREIYDNIQKGRPVTDYLDEIGEIIQRMTPKTAS